MKIVVSMDSFKGSLTSWEAGNAAKIGIERALATVPGEHHEVVVFPLADGGEGTVEAITAGNDGMFRDMIVQGPLGDSVSFIYGILPDNTIIMEMAQAAGRSLIPQDKRNPMKTSTYGLGQAIANVIKEEGGKPTKFKISVGGSATNDCGVGMLRALGYRFLDEAHNELRGVGEDLSKIVEIDDSEVIPGLENCTFEIATDVQNPLYGEDGAAYKFASQKGADKNMIEQLDDGMHNFADVVFWYNATDETQTPGAGAAGGLGYAFLSFMNSKFVSGTEMTNEAAKIKENLMKGASLMITGEGCVDEQTLNGKGPARAAQMAKDKGIPVIAIGGSTSDDLSAIHDAGWSACFSILNTIRKESEILKIDTATKNMERTAEEVVRVLLLGAQIGK